MRIFLFLFVNVLFADPLPSWNEGETKNRIIEFVRVITDSQNPNFIPVEDRIATFDQDGTLWVEQPLYTQFIFALNQIKKKASEHPEWKDQEPYKWVIENNVEKFKTITEQDIAKIIAVTHAGLSVHQFYELVGQFLKTAEHPRFKRPFTELVYQPMIELISYLQDNQFKTYIVSGGGQEFMRVYAKRVYNIPHEQIIGSAGKTKYHYNDGKPYLEKLPAVLYIDDKEGKPEAINLIIGKKPVAAFGNSDGDRQMLEWTQSGEGKRLELLVHHDDADREYAYGPDSKIGTFSESLMQEAREKKWIVVSMKDDWKKIFSWE
jgi:phosphoglycolate phosphatase-like HAD superfamily hydrolase